MASIDDTYYILMGDVIRSRDYELEKLAEDLRDLVQSANRDFRSKTLSPYTITLGDEFQGVTQSLESGIETLFYFEEQRLARQWDFSVRYVLHHGKIDTEINPETSYGMLGEGLAQARNQLASKKRDRKRFQVSLDDRELGNQINRLFEVLSGITDRWKTDDFTLIHDMIRNENDQEVGDIHGKDRSQIYKRRKTLLVKEYTLLKESIFACTKLRSL